MIVVNFLGNNCYNLSTVEPDYVKLFLFINSVDNINPLTRTTRGIIFPR